MSSGHKDISGFNPADFPSVSSFKIGIVVSQWNNEITEALFRGAFDTLITCGIRKENIFRSDVPGSFELPLGAQRVFETNHCDAVICIGCVIRGDTPHFDFICSAVSNGIMDLNLKHKTPFIFGVLTCNTREQALERSGGRLGNKGVEAAASALKMAVANT